MAIASWLKNLLGEILRRGDKPAPQAEDESPRVASNEQDNVQGSYVSDAPVKEREEDVFDRWAFARRIADTIASRVDVTSIVIGVYGPWGEGKTSLLNFIHRRLSDLPRVVVLRFNPWTFRDDEQLVLSFFQSLAQVLHASLNSKKESLGRFLKDYGAIVAGLSGSSRAEAVRRLGERLSTAKLSQRRERVESLLNETGARVVVMMDDIDRMDKTEIQTVFKLIKLTADFDHTAYILAFDDEMVAAALSETYPCAGSGHGFLEKIVQVPLRLPRADPIPLRQMCFQGVEQALHSAGIQVAEEDLRSFALRFATSLQVWLDTPRKAKQYANALLFSLPLVKGEVNVVEFMLIEGLRVLNTPLYTFIQNHPDFFLCTWASTSIPGSRQKKAEEAKKAIETQLEPLPPEQSQAARDLLTALFPRLESVFGSTNYGEGWDKTWREQKRIASPDYFSRYFRYSVAADDVSDQEVQTIIDDAPTLDITRAERRLRHSCQPQRAEAFLAKLHRSIHTLQPAASETLACALSRIGDILPRPQSMFPFEGAFSRAAIVVSTLVKSIPEEQRLDVAKRLLRQARPLSFGVASLNWMRTRSDKDDPTSSLSESEIRELGKDIIHRIRDLSARSPLYVAEPRETVAFLQVWADLGSRQEVREYLESTLDADPANAVHLVGCFAPDSWVRSSSVPTKGDLMRESYNALAHLIDPSIVYDKLKQVYGQSLDTKDYPHIDEGPLEEKLARQFAHIHHHVVDEQQAKEDPSERNGQETE